jgi:hypothetical protein
LLDAIKGGLLGGPARKAVTRYPREIKEAQGAVLLEPE